jgi:DNA-binding CsgD family transcriptional regulator
MPSTLLQKVLGDLRAARVQATAAERGPIDAAIVDILEGILAKGGMPSAGVVLNSSEPDTVPVPTAAQRPMSKHSPFHGMGLKEACPKLLSLVGKPPKTAKEIWDALEAEGWESNHSNPVHSVNDALRRRAKTHGDVLLVGAGKWGKPEWYSDAELEEIRKSIGGMGGRDRGDHIERTKAGMATAKRRGARLGATRKLSDEQGRQIVDRVRAGATKEKIAKEFDISTASVNNYVKAFSDKTMRELRSEGKRLRATALNPSSESDPEETRH